MSSTNTRPTVEAVTLDSLHPAAWNPRTISDERFQNLCQSIEADSEFLSRRPVLAHADGTIFAGNMRYRAAEHLGMETIPAIVEDVSDQLAGERAMRDNAQWGTWEEDDLASLLQDLRADGSDLELLGFEEGELQQLLAKLEGETAGLTDPDDVPEPPDEPITKLGDLWLLGDHRVLCGDSTSADDVACLLEGTEPHLMITDPPYGVSYDPEWRIEAGLSPTCGAPKLHPNLETDTDAILVPHSDPLPRTHQ